jgi:peroxiredoxin
MPSLAKLYNEFKESGFVILAVDIAEKKEVVRNYLSKAKLPFPVLLDTDGKVAAQYGIRAHPAHFLLDGEGKMIGAAMGARNWASDETRNLIRFLINQNGKKRIIEGRS